MSSLKDKTDRDILVELHTQMRDVRLFMESHSKRLVNVERRLWVLAGIGAGVTTCVTFFLTVYK